jgi:hypothetical protein
MVRTKQTARKCKGGVVNRKLLSMLAKRVGQPFITEKRGPITLGTYDAEEIWDLATPDGEAIQTSKNVTTQSFELPWVCDELIT